ncbi:hypothetical protein ZWY2020_030794 [Hordeum vulgare]|nr:hypothetical protein ZWY2020_030794 [Hordeum vulgare]
MNEDDGLVLAAALTGGIFVVLLVLLVVVLVRRRWLDREGAASGRGFVLFGVCCQDGNQGRFVRTSSLARSRQRAARGGEEADDEPDEGELERWKKMFGGPTRCLSTIEEATEKGTSTVASPAFFSPAASPDRRDARAAQTASAGVLKS